MKVRTTITLEEKAMNALDEYASVLGLSRSAVISGMIDEAIPTLEKVTSEFKNLISKTNGDLTQKDIDKMKNRILLHMASQLNGEEI